MTSRRINVGLVYPHTEIGGDAAAIRDFAVTAEALGFSHIMAFDHVLNGSATKPGYETRYNTNTPFTDPFVLFAYLASITTTLGFISGVLILPQRQTALVAKQAADVALLSGNRLRLGIGTGWNELEYEALGVPFERRGKRQEEQVDVLRRLWQNAVVTYEGRYHRLSEVGITPLPSQTIPVWYGGNSDLVLKRAARTGDGWIPLARPGKDLEGYLERLHELLAAEGRDPAAFGIEGFANLAPEDPDRWLRQVEAWEAAGASHLSLRTMPVVNPAPRPGHDIAWHLDLIRRVAAAIFA
jgi:probable F420-dependent oxidoreductase